MGLYCDVSPNPVQGAPTLVGFDSRTELYLCTVAKLVLPTALSNKLFNVYLYPTAKRNPPSPW